MIFFFFLHVNLDINHFNYSFKFSALWPSTPSTTNLKFFVLFFDQVAGHTLQLLLLHHVKYFVLFHSLWTINYHFNCMFFLAPYQAHSWPYILVVYLSFIMLYTLFSSLNYGYHQPSLSCLSLFSSCIMVDD